VVVPVKLTAGRCRHRIRIEQQVQAKNSFGETAIEWEEVATYWCEIRPLSARELYTGQEIQPEVSTLIIMRYNSVINASMRGVHVVNGADGTIYNLSPPIRDPETGLDWMTIPATSLLTAG
jgi:SPP1 family predicted phage head-tail adaptor